MAANGSTVSGSAFCQTSANQTLTAKAALPMICTAAWPSPLSRRNMPAGPHACSAMRSISPCVISSSLPKLLMTLSAPSPSPTAACKSRIGLAQMLALRPGIAAQAPVGQQGNQSGETHGQRDGGRQGESRNADAAQRYGNRKSRYRLVDRRADPIDLADQQAGIVALTHGGKDAPVAAQQSAPSSSAKAVHDCRFKGVRLQGPHLHDQPRAALPGKHRSPEVAPA